MKLRDLALRLRALFRPGAVERELNEELAFHLELETRKLIAEGLPPHEARARAKAKFGSVALTADECRDARGTSFVDGLVRDLIYAMRMFRRAPLPAFTIVTTLGLGLGLVAMVFSMASPFLFRVDKVPNVGEIYEFRAEVGSGDAWVSMTRPAYEAFSRETKVFSDPFAMIEDIDSRIDGRMMGGTLVTGNFFDALGVRAAAGRAIVPADDDRVSPNPVLVLSHRGWVRRFQSDPTVVGRVLQINGRPFQIVGIMPEGFRGLAIGAPDYWAPLRLLGQVRPIHLNKEDAAAVQVVGRLRAGLSKSAAIDELSAWRINSTGLTAKKYNDERVVLLPRKGTIKVPLEALMLFTPIMFAFGLILVIACANVANLLLARGVSRQREIGIRLSMGATRARVVRQLLTENFLLALAAAGLGYVISRVLLVGTIGAVTSTLSPEIAEQISLNAPAADWRVAVFLVAGAIVTTVLFALSPALQATRLELVRTIRGEVSRDAKPNRARNLLIGIQVTASAVLLTTSAIFLRSAMASSSADPGFRITDTVLIELNNPKTAEALLRAVESTPLVTAISASWPDLLSRPRVASAGLGREKFWANYKFVSHEHVSVLGLEILRGRNFTPAERGPEAAVAIVSETTARKLSADGNVLGQILHLEPDQTNAPRDETPLAVRAFTIVGVMRDIAGFRLGGPEAGILLPTNALAPKATLTVRVTGDVDQARTSLLTLLTPIDPDMGQVVTLKTLARLETYMLKLAFWLTVVLGGLALVLTLSGLFSVLSYLVEQRGKEIGVRIALGANARTIRMLVFSTTFRPVGVGLLIGTGLALALAIVLRSISTEISNIVKVLDPVAYALSLAVIVSACAAAALVPAQKAGRVDPIASLRQD